jgi:hypothetical protein
VCAESYMNSTVSEVLAASIFRLVEEGLSSRNDVVSQETGILVGPVKILSHFFSLLFSVYKLSPSGHI